MGETNHVRISLHSRLSLRFLSALCFFTIARCVCECVRHVSCRVVISRACKGIHAVIRSVRDSHITITALSCTLTALIHFFGLCRPPRARRFSGGIGQMDARHRTKGAAEAGMRLVKIGGPAYRIGTALRVIIMKTFFALCTQYGLLSMRPEALFLPARNICNKAFFPP